MCRHTRLSLAESCVQRVHASTFTIVSSQIWRSITLSAIHYYQWSNSPFPYLQKSTQQSSSIQSPPQPALGFLSSSVKALTTDSSEAHIFLVRCTWRCSSHSRHVGQVRRGVARIMTEDNKSWGCERRQSVGKLDWSFLERSAESPWKSEKKKNNRWMLIKVVKNNTLKVKIKYLCCGKNQIFVLR